VKISIRGLGWVNPAGWGTGRGNPFRSPEDETEVTLPGKEIFRRPFPRFGRMDRYSRLGIAAIALALKDAGLDDWTATREIGLIACTLSGSLASDEAYFDTVTGNEGRLASPNLFAYTLPNTFLGEAAIHFGLTGTSFVVNERSLTGLTGLNLAMMSITQGEHETIVAGTCDAGTSLTDDADPVTPGALFFVLHGDGRGGESPYGELVMEKTGRVTCEGREVSDLNSLAAMCAASMDRK
jgi:3-oxoacyl-[acyl-carrier-protein] synthase II